jgi:hypothetical protein
MQNTQQSGTQFAQMNLDAAMRMGTQAAEFWRRCAALQAQGANQVLEESVRMTRVILKTQSEMVDAAGQFLSEGNRTVFQNLEQAGQQAAETARSAARDVQNAAGNGSRAMQEPSQGGQSPRRAA